MISKNPQFRPILTALGISVGLNVAMMILDSVLYPLNPPSHQHPLAQGLLAIIETPARIVASCFAPSGHTLAVGIDTILIGFVSSVLFYGLLAWIILSLPKWLRDLRRLG